ncbi:hypothetical protein [Sphingomonas spermidinifaciens]|uniref:hypothetical protein n=1 Tax=Sphingomonas spermidinifaciens TaxID=1141889 RepID=UPI0011430398|nr:hypothetical protein [Sphingomonas spermidinifaciens]
MRQRHQDDRVGKLARLSAAMISIAPGAAAPASAAVQLPVLNQHFASSPQTCSMLQAAYMTARGRTKPATYPKNLRFTPRITAPRAFVPDYRDSLPLSKREFAHLVDQQSSYGFPNFRPACPWKGVPDSVPVTKGDAGSGSV